MADNHLQWRDSAAKKPKRDPRPWSLPRSSIPKRLAKPAFLSDKENSEAESGLGPLVITFPPGEPRPGKFYNFNRMRVSSGSALPVKDPVDHDTVQRDLGRLNISSLPPQFPFPWLDTATAKILTTEEITLKLGIKEIRGEVECTNCHQTTTIGLDLKIESKLTHNYIKNYKDETYYKDRSCYKYNSDGYLSPDEWLNPVLRPCPNISCCRNADQGGLKAVIPDNEIDYQKINWLFLFVSNMLGCCSVEQLDFFCKHNVSDCHHRRACGAKNRLLYLTYVTICNQLYPMQPIDYPTSTFTSPPKLSWL